MKLLGDGRFVTVGGTSDGGFAGVTAVVISAVLALRFFCEKKGERRKECSG